MRAWLPLVALSLVIGPSAAGVGAEPAPAASAATAAEFHAQVEPFFTRYCLKCHGAEEPKGEFSLQGYLSRATIVPNREAWEKVSRKLHDREMPPEEEPQPEAAERERATGWIDQQLARFDCGRDRDPGRVTIRRLNRNEYNNTIRDLLGVDFHPADDFPSDDVGYGFDNIGDVLSMPPILLEKYLSAAEKIAERALGTDQVNLVSGETSGGEIIEGGGRILTHKLEVSTPIRMFGQGEYMFRVRAYGEQAGDEPVKMSMYLDNKLIRDFEVKALENKPELYEGWMTTKGGQRTFSIVFQNDYYEPEQPAPNDRNLIISNLEVMGPYPPSSRLV
ncbi:MAG TPA: DUF1587 domain-containing protein, partial [Pirellulales bacterium]